MIQQETKLKEDASINSLLSILDIFSMINLGKYNRRN